MNPYSNDKLRALLPYPKREANKYSRGRLVVVAGSSAYPGAACLAALAGQRMGAGYTEVVTEEAAIAFVRIAGPSLVVRNEATWAGPASVVSSPIRPCALAVGSGFDPDEGRSSGLLYRSLDGADAPVLVDGGALAALSSDEGRALCRERFLAGKQTVVTPHGGEAARLAAPLGLPCDDPSRLAMLLSLAYGVVVVLKGPDTWISDGEESYRMDEGTPALAKAGTGDVLAGMVGSLLAQGLDPFDACVLATTLHARAARFAAQEQTSISVIPEDVIEHLPKAIMSLKAQRDHAR